MNQKVLKSLILLVLILMLQSGCIPAYRSAMPLNPGELQVCYNAPLAGNARIGITKKLQYRISAFPFGYEMDLCYCWGNKLNYACAVGLIGHTKDSGHIAGLPVSAAGITLTLSKSVWKKGIPYLSLNYNNTFDGWKSSGQVSFGIETCLTDRSKRWKIVAIPELNLVFGGISWEGTQIPVVPLGSLGIGFAYDF